MPTIFISPDESTPGSSGLPVPSGKKPMKKSLKKSFTPVGHPPGHMGPFTTFSVNPHGIRFETQEEEEKVILFLRQHIIVNVPWVIITIILLLSPTVLLPLFFRLVNVTVALPAGYLIVGTLFWYLATFGFALANFIGWFFNIYIVTNERVIDIDFYYLLYKQFSEAELTKVQDISYSTGGIIAALFNYGNVIVQTAGESPNLEFEKVPFPEKVVETIRSLTEDQGGGV